MNSIQKDSRELLNELNFDTEGSVGFDEKYNRLFIYAFTKESFQHAKKFLEKGYKDYQIEIHKTGRPFAGVQ